MRKENKFSKSLVASAFILMIGIAPAFAESAGAYMDDAAITAKVKAALLANSQVRGTKVSVETTQGVVQLSGNVANKNEETEAVRAASKVDGVKSVKDLMTVQGTQDLREQREQ